MAVALEDLLREAAKRGLTHLSLHPVHSEDNKTVYWRCSATPSTMHKYVSTTTLDPVESVAAVLKAMPKAQKRSTKELTVAVKAPGHTDLMITPEAIDDAIERDQLDPAADWMLKP